MLTMFLASISMLINAFAVAQSLLDNQDISTTLDKSKRRHHHRKHRRYSSSTDSYSTSSSGSSTSSGCSSSSSSSSSSKSTNSCSSFSDALRLKKRKHHKRGSSSSERLDRKKTILVDFRCTPLVASCEQFKCILPFVNCRTVEPCKPYVEFNNIVVFLTTINGIENPLLVFESKDPKLQANTIYEVSSFHNYDGLYPFYYNCDVNNNLDILRVRPVFDREAVAWFLNRFYYFLSLYLPNGCVNPYFTVLPDGQITFSANGAPFDFVNIPKDYVQEYDGPIETIFNILLTDSSMAPIVKVFTTCLYVQIAVCCYTCTNNATTDTTLSIYCKLLKNFLITVNTIVWYNETIIARYFVGQRFATFVVIPTTQTTVLANASVVSTPTSVFSKVPEDVIEDPTKVEPILIPL